MMFYFWTYIIAPWFLFLYNRQEAVCEQYYILKLTSFIYEYKLWKNSVKHIYIYTHTVYIILKTHVGLLQVVLHHIKR